MSSLLRNRRSVRRALTSRNHPRWPRPGVEELERYLLMAAGDFQYGTTVTPSPINPTASSPAQGSVVNQAGVGNFAAPSGIVLSAAGTGTDLVVGSVTVTDLGLGAFVDTYGPTPTTVQVGIRDVTSGQVGSVTFTGSIVGAVRGNVTSDSSSFVNPAFTSASPSITLGGTVYTVTVNPTTDFSPPGAPFPGATGLTGFYTFHITVGPASSPSPPTPTPPSTSPNNSPIAFQYGTSLTPSPINPTSSNPAQGSVVNLAGVGSFPTPTGTVFDAAGALGTDIVVGTISVTDLGVGPYTDTYGPTTIHITTEITDLASGMTRNLDFGIPLSGTVTSNGTTSAATFGNPFSSIISPSIVIGMNKYTLTFDPTKCFSAPGGPPSGGTGLTGEFVVHVTAAPFLPPITATPVNVKAVEGLPDIDVPVATFTDPDTTGRASDYAAMVDWGDGTTTAGTITQSGVGTFEVTGTHTYLEESLGSPYTTHVSILRLDNANTGTATGTAAVTDAPLSAQGATVHAVEGQGAVNVAVVAFQDSDPNTTISDFPTTNVTIDWGDGTTTNASTITSVGGPSGVSYTATGTHTYAEAGVYQTHIVVADVGGAAVNAFGQAIVSDAALTVTTSAIHINEGAEFSGVLATFTDQNPNAPITDYSATIDWGDGTTTTGTIGFGPSGRNIAGSHTWAEAGGYQVTVTLHDVDGASASNSNSAAVGDPALTSLEPTTLSGVEGQLIDKANVGGFHDPNLLAVTADFLAIVDWGDGTPTQTGTVVPVGGDTTTGSLWKVLDSHTYAEEGQYTITVTLTDEDTPGTTYTITSHASIADAPLVSNGVHLTGIEGMPIGGQTTADVATFTDTDPTSTTADFSAVIAWGDGTTSPGVINSTGGPNGVVYTVTYAFANRHFYAEEGSYPLVVTITDVGGSKSIANGDVLVADAPPTQVSADNITVTEGQHFFLPLATFFEGPVGMPEPISDFTATIQWGDGSPPSLGTLMPGTGGAINVFGGHTYADSGVNGGTGTYRLTVTIHDDGGSIVRAMPLATVRDVPITLVSLLNPASDTGVSNGDGITKNNQPSFVGLSEKFSDVMLVGVPSGGGSPLFLGQTQADSAGAWTLKSRLIPDGSYTVLAVAVDESGHTTAMSQVLPGIGAGPLVIDTVGPRINFFGFNRLTGQFFTVYQDDRSGMDQHSILNGANYLASKIHIKLGDTLVTSLNTLTPLSPTAPQLVTGLLNNGQIIKGGSFFFTIRSGGVQDVAGNALDGEFFGRFPTGDGRPGGDFNARVDAIHNLVFPAQPTQSTAAPPVSLASVPVPVIDTAIQSLGNTKKKH